MPCPDSRGYRVKTATSRVSHRGQVVFFPGAMRNRLPVPGSETAADSGGGGCRLEPAVGIHRLSAMCLHGCRRHGAARHVSFDVAVGGDLLLGRASAALHLCLEESMRNNCRPSVSAAGLSAYWHLKKKRKDRLSLTTRHSCSGITGFCSGRLIAACCVI